MKKEKYIKPSLLTQILYQRRTVFFLLAFICIIGLPLRMENINLNGYVSDDAWWHYRHIKEVVDLGKRSDVDIYEFTKLNRPMTYPPVFHYVVAYTYKIFGFGSAFIKFTHYFNILEGLLYILLIYQLSVIFSHDRLFSLIGALSAAVSYGVIIRARAGELMPFVPADLLAFTSIIFLLEILKTSNITAKKSILFCMASGILMGLSMLSWSGTIYVYLPLALFAFIAIILTLPKLSKKAFGLFLLFFVTFLIICLPWYLPLVLKYGLNPHPKEMSWFMKGFTVLHQVKSFSFYILTSGIPIFFIPIAFLNSVFKRDAINMFLSFWIIVGLVATYTGWRGYVAVMPIISSIAISVALARIVNYFFKDYSKYISFIFIIVFLLLGIIGFRISDMRLTPLDPNNINEVRTNAKSIKMLEFLKKEFPRAITIDHISWISEDAAVGQLRMVSGQYLEYLPPGSSEALKDISRAYLSDEEAAYNICQKYNADLIIVRKQLLQLPQLSLLFAPSELKSEDYLKLTKDSPASEEVTITFAPKGMQSMLFNMLNRQKLNRFELIYVEEESGSPLPFAVVYKVKK